MARINIASKQEYKVSGNISNLSKCPLKCCIPLVIFYDRTFGDRITFFHSYMCDFLSTSALYLSVRESEHINSTLLLLGLSINRDFCRVKTAHYFLDTYIPIYCYIDRCAILSLFTF